LSALLDGRTLPPGFFIFKDPDVVDFLNWPNPSGRSMALGSTQPLTKMNTKEAYTIEWMK
jgi:hypothetical protein